MLRFMGLGGVLFLLGLTFIGIGWVGAADMPLAALSTVLVNAQKELELANESYLAGDMAGAEQAVVHAARLLYAIEPPQTNESKQYAEMTSKVSLLMIRINRLLHEVSPELEPEKFTMPVPYNSRIERQIDYFLTTDREEYARWLRRSGRYVPILRSYFEKEGLPGDLVYLALIESGFNPRNRSSQHAVGLFQFIKDTAELVGLKEDMWIDERRHPEKAAWAAIKHLKSLYTEFHDWDLALAAYNAGSGRVRRAMQDQGIKNYWQLVLPPETEAYVPKFYATLIIAKEPELYGFNPDYEDEEDAEVVEVPGGVDLQVVADAAGVTLAVISNLNPELTKGCTPPGETYGMRFPKGTAQLFQTNFAVVPEGKKFMTKEEVARRKFKDVYFVYTIKNGDSLYKIALKYHISIVKLKRWNPSISKDKYIHPGNKIRIYRGD